MGKNMKIIALELNPEIITPNTIKSDAIEFLEAKKPLVVENNPISAKAKIGRLISGERNRFSMLLCHENMEERPPEIFPKKLWMLKSFTNSNSIKVAG